MNQRTKNIIFLVMMSVLTFLILKNFHFNLNSAAFEKLIPSFSQTDKFSDFSYEAVNQKTEAISPLNFPQDEGAHPNLSTEWWYFAGHFEDEENPAHQFSLTLKFDKNPPRLAFNLSDGKEQENFSGLINFEHYDILAADKLDLKKGDILWTQTGDFKYQLHFKFEDKQVDLDLDSLKNPFLFSTIEGLFYYIQPRLEAAGELTIKDKHYKIKGQGWIDHEGFKETASFPWKSWRWHALQLDNKVEMVFSSDYTSDSGKFFEKSELSIFNSQGGKEIIKPEDYQITNLKYWQDSRTGIKYPVQWRLEIPARQVDLVASAIVANQLMGEPISYYNGSCQVAGIFGGEKVSGRAQFEDVSLRENQNAD